MDEFVKRASKLEEIPSVEVSFPRGFSNCKLVTFNELTLPQAPQVTFDLSPAVEDLLSSRVRKPPTVNPEP